MSAIGYLQAPAPGTLQFGERQEIERNMPCPNCGSEEGSLYEVEDRDDSVGYHAIELRCTSCNEPKPEPPQFILCLEPYRICCTECGMTADEVAEEVLFLASISPAVCCEPSRAA